jgi:hypothetical protein
LIITAFFGWGAAAAYASSGSVATRRAAAVEAAAEKCRKERRDTGAKRIERIEASSPLAMKKRLHANEWGVVKNRAVAVTLGDWLALSEENQSFTAEFTKNGREGHEGEFLRGQVAT